MLSKKTKYAIKALIHLGKAAENQLMHITDIAERENIPVKYLSAILGELRNAGLVHSKKGVAGGYSLNKKPEDIPLVQILRLTDGPIAMVSCASLNYYHKCEECLDESTCGIKNTFIIIRDACLNILSQKSIADLIEKEKELSELKLLELS
ncbi:Rrf2 family transcriptional regulator [Mucilaginibacter sp. BT774]|uniref:RrF2 family transcriptional regulator n=1 Tax=Mucilaginibacter sp. BT774 TaxID=3062276 RepID=UPI0026754B8E|nr:Rrf2 family transcriptional regulator [Mucilaginibacter sp. BT774]MDO3626780.1 Rrf2 family transcriptional regulator [Mucilaginibacter sp. BT774]